MWVVRLERGVAEAWPFRPERSGALKAHGWRFWLVMYSLIADSGAPPQEPAK